MALPCADVCSAFVWTNWPRCWCAGPGSGSPDGRALAGPSQLSDETCAALQSKWAALCCLCQLFACSSGTPSPLSASCRGRPLYVLFEKVCMAFTGAEFGTDMFPVPTVSAPGSLLDIVVPFNAEMGMLFRLSSSIRMENRH